MTTEQHNPAETVQFDNFPDDIKNYPFVVWKREFRNGIETKPPYTPPPPDQPDSAPVYASSIDRTTWSDFDTCQEFLESHTDYGLGIILGASTDGTNLIGIDMDSIDKIAPEHREESERLRREILRELDTYTDVSPSGKGVHVIGRGYLPNGATEYNALKIKYGIEMYAAKRFLTMTGRRVETKPREFRDIQQAINEFVAKIEALTGTKCGEDFDQAGTYKACGRRLDLTDEQVLELAQVKEAFAKGLHDRPSPAGKWSDVNFTLIGDLDKITGDPDQILRIGLNLPYVTQSPPAGNGESRLHKLERTLASILKKVRPTNDDRWHYLEVGRKAAAVFLAEWDAERAEAEADRARELEEATERTRAAQAKLAATPDSHNDAISPKLMQTVRYIACGIDDALLRDGAPAPDVLETLIHFNTKGMKVPFRKFAVISTLGTFSGLIGRKYKDEDGLTPALYMILGAISGGGKGEAFRFWQVQINRANMGNNTARQRFLTSRSPSERGLHDAVTDGAKIWMLEECSSQLSIIYGNSDQNEGVKNKINQLFDASEHHIVTSPPASVAAQKESKYVYNATVSILWSTTDDTLKDTLKGRDLASGLGSRSLIYIHDDKVGTTARKPLKFIPGDWNEWLIGLLNDVSEVDDRYMTNVADAGEAIVYVPYATEALELKYAVESRMDALRNAVAERESKLPRYYVIFNRVAMLAAKIACLSAVLRDRLNPRIEYRDYAWGLGYVLRSCAELVTALDEGRIDVKLSDYERVVLRAFERELKVAHENGKDYVTLTAFHDYIDKLAPTKKLANERHILPSALRKPAIAALVEKEILVEQKRKLNGSHKDTTLYVCGESDYWKEVKL